MGVEKGSICTRPHWRLQHHTTTDEHAAPLIFTCEHGIDAGIHRQMKTYFERQNLTLCAPMTAIADGYADMFGQIRSAYDHMREGPMNLIEAHEDLVICAAEMKAVSGNFRALNGIPPI